MSAVLGRSLGSYDFYAKSLPGIFFILCLATLLPDFPVSTLEDLDTPSTILIISGLVFSGLVFGQFVHTLAEVIETSVYLFGKLLSDRTYIRNKNLISHARNVEKEGVLNNETLYGIYTNLHYLFKDHRTLFGQLLLFYFNPAFRSDGYEQNDVVYNKFREILMKKYDIDLELFENEHNISIGDTSNYEKLYPIIAANVAKNGGQRSSGFHSRYAFCRSMWVVLLLTSIFYISILIGSVLSTGIPQFGSQTIGPQYLGMDSLVLLITSMLLFTSIFFASILFGSILSAGFWLFDYQTIAVQHLGMGGLFLLTVLMLVLTIVFAWASGVYKRHYIEYLIIEYVEFEYKNLTPVLEPVRELG